MEKENLKMIAAKQPKSILDIATGTGDLAILFANTSATEIIGLDISQGMLDIGKKNCNSKLRFENSNGLRRWRKIFHIPDNYFDAITVAYGVRNLKI